MVYYNGTYHLFYQHNPDDIVWGPMHWGHAISTDLSTWTHLPIALYPDEWGTIYSGSAIVDFNNTAGFKNYSGGSDPIVAIYTNEGLTETQSIAYSLDGGMTFTKYSGNPVLNGTQYDFRDPKVFFHEGRWVMTLAVLDRIEFFTSPDLKSWTKAGEFGKDPLEGSHAGVWECPDLVKLPVELPGGEMVEVWVLLVSISAGAPNGGSGTQYFIGNFTSHGDTLEFQTFPWSQAQWLDFGHDNYAGVTFSNDPFGRSILMGWMSNQLYSEETPNLSHRGQFTIPRQLGVVALNHTEGQYRLTSNPVPELASLRDPDHHSSYDQPFIMNPGNHTDLNDLFNSPLLELEIELDHFRTGENIRFSICANNLYAEEICFGFNDNQWFLDRSDSGRVDFGDFYDVLRATQAREATNESTTIRIFLDVSTFEVFADGGLTVMSALHYPRQRFDGFYIYNWYNGSPLTVKQYQVWGLKCWFPASED